MLIDHTLYNWSQTAPITITLEALEQEVASAVPVRIYKVSGTAQVSFYADAEKSNLLYSGPLPWMPTEPVACDGLYVVAESARSHFSDGGHRRASTASSATPVRWF